jgi:hypothetical protein
MIDLQHRYDVLLCAFIGAIMAQSGCGTDEALKRIATLCAITEDKVFKGGAKA